jgi:hypothetical protein
MSTELEAMVISLKKEVEKLKAVNQIQNMMGRYEYWLTSNQYENIARMFAKNSPGVQAELNDSGVFKGYDGAWKLYVDIHKFMMQGPPVGKLTVHTLTTPVIEVAGDGQTARGLWISPGYLTAPNREEGAPEGSQQAFWLLEEYKVDFIKEDGEWKIWHFHLYRTFCTPYEKSWVNSNSHDYDVPSGIFPPEMAPDGPTTYYNTYTTSTVNGMVEYVPPAPEPYDTWDDSMLDN